MSARYDSIKSMRAARIGTIMPWGGDGGNGNLPSNIPKGWITCTGQQNLMAKDYPLLAAELGDTYGGDMTTGSPVFPYQDSTASFGLPNLSSYVVVDLEPSHLADPKYQFNQNDAAQVLGDAVKDLGQTTPINTQREAVAALEFTLNLAGSLYVKYTGIQLNAPDFNESVYTLSRKLGMNHTPRHRHADTIPSANVRSAGGQPFHVPMNPVRMFGDAKPDICTAATRSPVSCEVTPGLTLPSWANGRAEITYYATSDMEDSLPMMSGFKEYISDTDGKDYWGYIPAGDDEWKKSHLGTARTAVGNDDRGSGHKDPTYTQSIGQNGVTQEIPQTIPMDTHKQPAYKGMFPRPVEEGGRPNFLGYTDLSNPANSPPIKGGITDHPEEMDAFFVDDVVFSAGAMSITLPTGVDIRREYGASPNNWYQWDKITPFMYVTTASADVKYKYLEEGTQILSMERLTSGAYKLNLNWPIKADSGSSGIELKFRHATYPTSLNTTGPLKNPLNAQFKSHNHDSFEIFQHTGSMPTQAGTFLTTYTAANANGSSLQPDAIPNALNISIDSAQPSVTTTFIIKAF